MDNLLKSIEELAHKAADAILDVYNSDDFEVQLKGDDSPLTRADLAAHNVIMQGLQALTPEVPVLSEESAEKADFSVRSNWQKYWLVDPLDGTKEFIKRNGEFTVNIALIDRGVPVLSCVHVPVTGVAYSAARGIGVFKREGGQKKSIIVQKSSRYKPLVVGSRSHRSDALNAYLENMGQYEIVSMGSSLKFCLVAEGKADLYPRLGPTCEWDTAAAQCIVEQAGGHVLSLEDGQPLRYNQRESLLNPHFVVFGDPGKDWLKFA